MIKLNNKVISLEDEPVFIADIGANHDGDLTRALKLIELAARSGADAAKFQNFSADLIVSKRGFDILDKKLDHQAGWKKSVFETYLDASIDTKWTKLLKEHCKNCGIEYFTSPYDFKSVDHIKPFVNWIKIGSGDITWLEIIEYISKQNKNIILATGASDMFEVNRAVSIIKKNSNNLVLMQCNTNYTGDKSNFHYCNLNVLKEYKKKFPDIILGLSDHTKGYSTVLGALALGARVFEKHFTDDNNRDGPDHKFAMNPCSWSEMVKASKELFFALGDGKKKVEKNELDTFYIQRRGLWITKNLRKNDVISNKDIIALRPLRKEGYSADQIDDIIGKRLKHYKLKNDFLQKGDLQ